MSNWKKNGPTSYSHEQHGVVHYTGYIPKTNKKAREAHGGGAVWSGMARYIYGNKILWSQLGDHPTAKAAMAEAEKKSLKKSEGSGPLRGRRVTVPEEADSFTCSWCKTPGHEEGEETKLGPVCSQCVSAIRSRGEKLETSPWRADSMKKSTAAAKQDDLARTLHGHLHLYAEASNKSDYHHGLRRASKMGSPMETHHTGEANRHNTLAVQHIKDAERVGSQLGMDVPEVHAMAEKYTSLQKEHGQVAKSEEKAEFSLTHKELAERAFEKLAKAEEEKKKLLRPVHADGAWHESTKEDDKRFKELSDTVVAREAAAKPSPITNKRGLKKGEGGLISIKEVVERAMKKIEAAHKKTKGKT